LTHADARRDVAQVDMPRAGEMADGRAEVSITSAQQGEEDIERAEQGAGDPRDAARAAAERARCGGEPVRRSACRTSRLR